MIASQGQKGKVFSPPKIYNADAADIQFYTFLKGEHIAVGDFIEIEFNLCSYYFDSKNNKRNAGFSLALHSIRLLAKDVLPPLPPSTSLVSSGGADEDQNEGNGNNDGKSPAAKRPRLHINPFVVSMAIE